MGNKVVRWCIYDNKTNQPSIIFYYTPVTIKLKKMGEKLGNYLHAIKSYKDTDQFWLRFRNELEEIFEKLVMANTGTLLGPPLMKKGTGQVEMNSEILDGVESNNVQNHIKITGENVTINVSYLIELPKTIEKEAYVWSIDS